jgi:hypothetical protein
MLFRIYRNVFTQSSAVLQFNVIAPTTNTVFDLAQLITNDLVIGNTSVAYTFNSTMSDTGAATGYLPILPLEDYYDDGYGRRWGGTG